MNFQTAVTTCFKKYADFNGRARRSEYWWFALFCIVLQVVVSMISSLLANVLVLALLLPSLAVGARRLHDINKTAWFLLLLLIPFIGALILIIMYCLEGTKGPNQYGPEPTI